MSKGEETKQRILKQALKLFSTKGYEETSLKDIAIGVDIKAPSIYAYFPSKEKLFENVTNFVMEEYLYYVRGQSSYLKKLSVDKQLFTLLENLNQYFYENDLGLFIKRYGMVPPEKVRDFLLQKYTQTENEIRELLYKILEGKSEKYIDTETIVTSFLCILNGMLFYLVNFSEEEYKRRLKACWEVFWTGINK